MKTKLTNPKNSVPLCELSTLVLKKMRITLLSLVFSILAFGFTYSQQRAGVIEWQKTFGGTANDEAYSIQNTSDGGFIVAGSTYSNDGDVSGNHGCSDFWLVKLDSIGNMQWQKCLGGTGPESAKSIQQTIDGGYIIAGGSASNDGDVSDNHGGGDFWVVKIDSIGNIEWQKCLGGTNNDVANSILQASDGSYIVVGKSKSNNGDLIVNNGDYDYWIVKLDTIGNIQWQKSFGGTGEDEALSVQQTQDNGFVVLGNHYVGTSIICNDYQSSNYDIVILKFDINGNIVSQKSFGDISRDVAYSINKTNDGNFIFVLNSNKYCPIDPYDFKKKLIKIDNNGNIIFQKDIVPYYLNDYSWVKQNSDNGYIIIGKNLIKLDSLADVEWKYIFSNSLPNSISIPNSIALNETGYVFAGRFNLTGSYDYNYTVAKVHEIIPNEIKGKIYNDANQNCIKESTENSINRLIIKAEPGNFYANIDQNGNYNLLTDTGAYKISQIKPYISSPLFYDLNCPNNPDYYTIDLDTNGVDTCCFDFANKVTECYLLNVWVKSNRRRRCFRNTTVIHYCNSGYAEANNVQVFVKFPEYVNLINSDHNYTSLMSKTYRFDIGALQAGECGDIYITDSVSCVNNIMGLTQCTKAWILPENTCMNQLVDTSTVWDKSVIKVTGTCIDGKTAYFVIENTAAAGVGDMLGTSEYKVFADGALAYSGTFQLAGGDSLKRYIDSKGVTIRLVAIQRPGYPGLYYSKDEVEACGVNSQDTYSMGFVNQLYSEEDNVSISRNCSEICGSYDPNDKKVIPSGVTNQHFVHSGTMLDYTVRFQNTGTDTAFTVVVIDTLSADFDISTFQQGASSHPYTLKVSGQNRPIFRFTFNNINLPDSSTNELASNGFLSFKIATYDTISEGKVVSNFADIYFDYNLPIRTDTAWVTISDSIITGPPIVFLNVQNLSNIDFKVDIYPNPATNEVTIEIHNNKQQTTNNKQFKLFSIDGKKLLEGKLESPKTRISTKDLEGGVYFIEVSLGCEKVNSKLVITK